MAVTVKTFASTSEAAGALSADRGARYLGGGTLVMRALNEGDVSVSTVIRASDQALTRIDASGPRVTLGAGITFAKSSPSATSASCMPLPARSADLRCATWARSGATCSRQVPMATSRWRCLRSMPPSPCRAALAHATSPSKSSCSRASGRPARWCSRCPAHGRRARTPSAITRSPVSSQRAAPSLRSQPICRSAADGSPGHGSRWARWRRPRFGHAPPSVCSRDVRWMPRPSLPRRPPSPRAPPLRQRARQRLVSPRDRRRTSAPSPLGSGIARHGQDRPAISS